MLREQRASGITNDDTASDNRDEYERDLDRLLYTYHFRRLAEVTQVASLSEASTDPGLRQSSLSHNRLTHSLKVGQVARRLTQYLVEDSRNHAGIEAAGGVNPNVAELAGRAHDIGHPPFGHIGEEVLDEFANSHGLSDGFEGNAQTFRILATLTSRHPVRGASPVEGLDLTSASLAACVKYPWPRGETGKRRRKYGYFQPDQDKFSALVMPRLQEDPQRGCLEAQIMDWADDITYAVHDIEDFYMSGLIPLDLLAHRSDSIDPAVAQYVPVNPTEVREFWEYATLKLGTFGKAPPDEEARNLFQSWATGFPRRKSDGSRRNAAMVGRIASMIITETSRATSVDEFGELKVDPAVRAVVEVLKQLTWFYVIDRPELVAVQRGQRLKLAAVCGDLFEWAEHAFATEVMTHGAARQLSEAEQRINQSTLPAPLSDYILDLLKAKSGSGAYPSTQENIARGVIDYVASLRELEVFAWYDKFRG